LGPSYDVDDRMLPSTACIKIHPKPFQEYSFLFGSKI